MHNPASNFPSDVEFAELENRFELTAPESSLDLAADGTQIVRWEGSYLLDNGGGYQKKYDEEHICCFKKSGGTHPNVSHFVVAKGRTEFGVFISVGFMEQITDAENSEPVITMTLARRYMINKRDPRYQSALEDRVADAQLLAHGKPWELIPLKALKVRTKRDTTRNIQDDINSREKRVRSSAAISGDGDGEYLPSKNEVDH